MTALPTTDRVTGFDLDMTLIDSRPGIKAVYEELSRQTGTHIDSDLAVSRLGPPLETELAYWFPPETIESMADRYRALYPALALPLIEPLPGAAAALAAARTAGRAIVITAKFAPLARLHLERLGLDADEVYGNAWRLGKADVLRAEGARMYVGDHVHDIDAAKAADAVGIGVATGPSSDEELLAAGATVVLPSLLEFPEYFATLTH